MEFTRQHTPKRYKLRWYPDITHMVRCQYPIPWLDTAWGVTLGREGVNPRPVDYAAIYQNDYRFADGFLSYSDGIHDDFNKCLWSQLAWQPDISPRSGRGRICPLLLPTRSGPGRGGRHVSARDQPAGRHHRQRVDRRHAAAVASARAKIDGTHVNWRFALHLFRAYLRCLHTAAGDL